MCVLLYRCWRFEVCARAVSLTPLFFFLTSFLFCLSRAGVTSVHGEGFSFFLFFPFLSFWRIKHPSIRDEKRSFFLCLFDARMLYFSFRYSSAVVNSVQGGGLFFLIGSNCLYMSCWGQCHLQTHVQRERDRKTDTHTHSHRERDTHKQEQRARGQTREQRVRTQQALLLRAKELQARKIKRKQLCVCAFPFLTRA